MTEHTNIYFDFEFIDDGREIVPISVGMCVSGHEHNLAQDDTPDELYLEYTFDPARCNDWVRANVLPHLSRADGLGERRSIVAWRIKQWVTSVCGDTKPRFWGWYPAYDWVCLAQHFGTLMQLPDGWPLRPECLDQLAGHMGCGKADLPVQEGTAHNALADAKWNCYAHAYLSAWRGR